MSAKKKKKQKHKAPQQQGFYQRIQAWFEDRNPILKFLLGFIGCMAIFYTFYYSGLYRNYLEAPFLNAQASLSNALLSLTGQATTVTGSEISGGGFSVNIKNGCDGLEAIAILISGILIFPVEGRKKAMGLAWGIPALLIANLFRIAGLYLAGKHFSREVFDVLHILRRVHTVHPTQRIALVHLDELGDPPSSKPHCPMKPILMSGLKYFLYFCLLYGALTMISLIPQVGSALNSMYRSPTEYILKKAFPSVHLQLSASQDDVDNIKVEYISKKRLSQIQQSAGTATVQVTGQSYAFYFYNTFLSFYLFFVSLMLLSPLPRRELMIGLIIGTLLYYLFSAFRVAMALAFFFNDPEADIFHAREFWVSVIKGINEFLTLGINLLVVLILWVGLAFRRNNWHKLLMKT